MNRKVVSGIMLTLVLLSMLTLAFNIQPFKSEVGPWPMFQYNPNTCKVGFPEHYASAQGTPNQSTYEDYVGEWVGEITYQKEYEDDYISTRGGGAFGWRTRVEIVSNLELTVDKDPFTPDKWRGIGRANFTITVKESRFIRDYYRIDYSDSTCYDELTLLDYGPSHIKVLSEEEGYEALSFSTNVSLDIEKHPSGETTALLWLWCWWDYVKAGFELDGFYAVDMPLTYQHDRHCEDMHTTKVVEEDSYISNFGLDLLNFEVNMPKRNIITLAFEHFAEILAQRHVHYKAIGELHRIGEKYILSIESATGGTTDPSPGSYEYDVGSEAVVTADPDEICEGMPYVLKNWALDDTIVDPDNPIVILMDSDHTLTPIYGCGECEDYVKCFAPTLKFHAHEDILPVAINFDGDQNLENNKEHYKKFLKDKEEGKEGVEEALRLTCYTRVSEWNGYCVYEYWYYYAYDKAHYLCQGWGHRDDLEGILVFVDTESCKPVCEAAFTHKKDRPLIQKPGQGWVIEWGKHAPMHNPGEKIIPSDGQYAYGLKAFTYKPLISEDVNVPNTIRAQSLKIVREVRVEKWIDKPEETYKTCFKQCQKLKELESVIHENQHQQVVDVHSSANIYVSDSQGRVTGLVDGEIREEIHFSYYFDEGVILIEYAYEDFLYTVEGVANGTYNLTIEDSGEEIKVFDSINISISKEEAHAYGIDWDALSQGEEGVTVQIDSDGNGIFEQEFTSDDILTQDEFMQQSLPIAVSPVFPMWIIGVAVATIITTITLTAYILRKKKQKH